MRRMHQGNRTLTFERIVVPVPCAAPILQDEPSHYAHGEGQQVDAAGAEAGHLCLKPSLSTSLSNPVCCILHSVQEPAHNAHGEGRLLSFHLKWYKIERYVFLVVNICCPAG
jgi:hypothetical protein